MGGSLYESDDRKIRNLRKNSEAVEAYMQWNAARQATDEILAKQYQLEHQMESLLARGRQIPKDLPGRIEQARSDAKTSREKARTMRAGSGMKLMHDALDALIGAEKIYNWRQAP
jgi:hypothetical protein